MVGFDFKALEIPLHKTVTHILNHFHDGISMVIIYTNHEWFVYLVMVIFH